MSIRVMSWVWDCGPEKGSDLLVLLALADFANDEGECWPSMASIARKARMTERGAQKIARRLKEDGFLEITTGGGRHGCNRYRIIRRETPNEVHPFSAETPNTVHPRTTFAPEQRDKKPRTAVHPNRQEPSVVGGGGDAGASERIDISDEDLWTELLHISGHRAGKIPRYWSPATATRHVGNWRRSLGLTAEQIIAVAKSEQTRFGNDPDDRPQGPKAYDKAMQLFAASLTAEPITPKLKAIPGGRQNERQHFDRAIHDLADRLSDGSAQLDYSSRDPLGRR
jgi:hypothetical protein